MKFTAIHYLAVSVASMDGLIVRNVSEMSEKNHFLEF